RRVQPEQGLVVVHAGRARGDDPRDVPRGEGARRRGRVLGPPRRLRGREGRLGHHPRSARRRRLRVRVPDDDDEPPPHAAGRDELHDDGGVALLHELAAREGGREPRRQRRRVDPGQRRAAPRRAREPLPAVGMKISSRLGAVKPSATFAMAAEAAALRAEGRSIIDLSVGEPDFDTPEHVKAAARDALARGLTKYTPIGGLDVLKDAVVVKLRRDNALEYARAEVMASCGGKHSLYTAFQALFDDGDEVVLPAPYWVSYPDMLLLSGAVPRIVTTTAGSGFRMTPDEFEAAIGPRTVAVILNSPSNPTGAAYGADELSAIGRVALRRKLVVITDDIYERLAATPVAHIGTLVPELRPNLVVVNSLSKTYAMTG